MFIFQDSLSVHIPLDGSACSSKVRGSLYQTVSPLEIELSREQKQNAAK